MFIQTHTTATLRQSIGVFYRGIIPKPQHLYDKYPQIENVKRLEEAFELPNECFHSIVLDLPFIVKDEASAQTSMVSQRFTSFLTMQELYETNDTMLNLAYRLLKKKGFLIMKTMDIKYSGNSIGLETTFRIRHKKLVSDLKICSSSCLKPKFFLQVGITNTQPVNITLISLSLKSNPNFLLSPSFPKDKV